MSFVEFEPAFLYIVLNLRANLSLMFLISVVLIKKPVPQDNDMIVDYTVIQRNHL